MKSIHSTIARSILATSLIICAGTAAAQTAPHKVGLLKEDQSCYNLQLTTQAFESNHAPKWAIDKIKARMAAIDCIYL